MSKDRGNKSNSGGEDFTLEEILAEFGRSGGEASSPSRRDLDDTIPLPILPRQDDEPPFTGKGPDNIVSFPGTGPLPRLNLQLGPEEDEEDNVLDFPEEAGPASDNPIAEGLNRLIKKADNYAEHMFEEEGTEDDEEVRRAEKYIPGVDEEDPPERRRERKPRQPPPPAPDLPPAQLYKRYGKGLGFLRLRAVLVLLLSLPLIYLSAAPSLGIPLPGALAAREIQLYAMAGLLGAAMLLGVDVLLRGLFRLLRLQMGMDTLLVFSCAAALADTLTLLRLNGREGQLPYCAAAALALAITMRGTWKKRRGLRAACRTAALASEPYLVTLDEGKWNGRDTYTKWSGSPIGFGRQIQADDGAQRIFCIVCPILFIACLLFSVMSSVGRERPQDILWCLSATLAAASSFSGALCFALPWDALSRRLSGVGAALAGWDGVVSTGGQSGILLTDADLFPPGSVSLNGIKIFGDFPVEKVVGVTATLIRDSGSGLNKIFHDLLRSQGSLYRRADRFEFHEGGGVSAEIRGDLVLVGSASFMHLMEIALPQGLNVKNAVFCAIDGELAGIFALNYTLNGAVEPALNALIRNRVGPVLATRDFNLIPAMLRQRFKLPVEKMDFPAVERRVELSDENQEHADILTAVLCREGVGPYADAVVGGKRLRLATRASALLACVGAVTGVLLAFYLTFVGSYASLSASNLLVFLIMWTIPTLLISGWVNRY